VGVGLASRSARIRASASISVSSLKDENVTKRDLRGHAAVCTLIINAKIPLQRMLVRPLLSGRRKTALNRIWESSGALLQNADRMSSKGLCASDAFVGEGRIKDANRVRRGSAGGILSVRAIICQLR
jgi:hypothetical protein